MSRATAWASARSFVPLQNRTLVGGPAARLGTSAPRWEEATTACEASSRSPP